MELVFVLVLLLLLLLLLDTGTALRFIAMRIELLAKCIAEIIPTATTEL